MSEDFNESAKPAAPVPQPTESCAQGGDGGHIMRYDAEANEMRFDPMPAQTAAQKLDFMLSAFLRETGYDLRPFIDAMIAEIEAENVRLSAAIIENQRIPGEYREELAICDKEIAKWKSEDEWYGVNFHQGRRSGIVFGNIVSHKEREQLAAQLSEVTRERDALKQESEDLESDSALIRKLAENIGINVVGNTHCVPGLVDIAEELTTRLAVSERERDALRAWKESAISVTPPLQGIAKALGVPLGASIHDKILPGIVALQKAVAECVGLQARVEEVVAGMQMKAAQLANGHCTQITREELLRFTSLLDAALSTKRPAGKDEERGAK